MDKSKYTRFVGVKFNDDGSVRAFPGNTVISKITVEMPIYTGLVAAQDKLKTLDFAGKYSRSYPMRIRVLNWGGRV